MKHLLQLLSLLAFTLTSLLADGVWAQEPVEADVRQARSLVESASAAFRAHDYLEALPLFRRAEATVHRAQLRFNIALTLERLARFREAAQEYGLAASSAELDPAARQRASEAHARVAAFTATLSFVTSVEGVSVEVDDGRECRAPCSLVMDPGSHSVFAAFPAGVSNQSVEISRGRDRTLSLVDPAALAPDTAASSRHARLGWTGVLGLGLSGVGVAGAIGFGLRTRRLHRDFVNAPTAATANDGDRARLLTNLSLGVALTGLVLVALDLWLVD